jgi:butyryl-CoA dehydrogenase
VQATAVQKALHGDDKAADSNFYQGKLHALRYFFAYELPKTIGMAERLMDEDFMTVEMNADLFQD